MRKVSDRIFRLLCVKTGHARFAGKINVARLGPGGATTYLLRDGEVEEQLTVGPEESVVTLAWHWSPPVDDQEQNARYAVMHTPTAALEWPDLTTL